MPFYEIKSIPDGLILYSGTFKNLRICVEQAIAEQVSLARADLRNTNLLNAMLDGADFRAANLSGSNLAGANLSEARLDDAMFLGANLTGAVLCESTITGAHFRQTQFGATMLDDSVIDRAHFSAPSAFTLDFARVRSMRSCSYINLSCQTVCPMSRPPVVIRGLARLLVLMDRHMKIGNDVQPLDGHSWPSSLGMPGAEQLRLRLEQIIAQKPLKAA